MYTPLQSAVWRRPVGGATARPCGDQYLVLWSDQYSVLFQLFARGRHCYAARATRWALPCISSFVYFWLVTHADGGREGRVFIAVCLCVCLFIFRTISHNTDTTRITKLDAQMFHDKSWKNHLFWGQKVKSHGRESQKQCRRGSLHSCECWLFLVRNGKC